MASEKHQDGRSPISTESYKGVRDFYPEDQFVENHIFGTWRAVAERYGYSEYSASILEPSELYHAKTGEEIVNEQTYSFTDRGGREVTLRPEMTPTVARMVAAKRKELSFPLRWFSMPNLFRYERPQKGRLREHWQLNVDLFGVPGQEAEIEIISVADSIMKAFGAKPEDYEIQVNSRELMNALFDQFALDDGQRHALSKLIDRKEKMPTEEFRAECSKICGEDNCRTLETIAEGGALEQGGRSTAAFAALESVRAQLRELGITTRHNLWLMRGFDYYTGIVFEVFDTDPENSRSLFGGGRYDRLLEIFGAEKIPAFGFGMGDVTIRLFLEKRGLVPAYRSPADAVVATAGALLDEASKLASELREAGLKTSVDLSGRKLGDQLKKAEKEAVRFAVIVGENELATGTFKVKDIGSHEETDVPRAGIADFIHKRLS